MSSRLNDDSDQPEDKTGHPPNSFIVAMTTVRFLFSIKSGNYIKFSICENQSNMYMLCKNNKYDISFCSREYFLLCSRYFCILFMYAVIMQGHTFWKTLEYNN